MPSNPTTPWGSTLKPATPDPADRPPWGGLGGPQPLLEPEYRPAYAAYKQTPGPDTADALLKAVRPVIDEALRSYAGTESGTATARARAKTMTLQAVRRYDPDRAKLRTHLLSHLRGLRRATERATAGVYVPEQWRLDARAAGSTRADLRDELGREPSDAEVADRSGVPLARVRRAAGVPGVLTGGQFGGQLAVTTPDEQAWNRWTDAIYHDLSPIDQTIIEHSFGMHGKPILPGNVIAKMVNLSPGAVSQRRTKIQSMLDEYENFLGRR